MLMRPVSRFLLAAGVSITSMALTLPAFANRPEDKGIAFQDAATPLAEEVHVFHNAVLMPIITVITLLVMALLIWVMVRYNSKANPKASKFSHNTLIEVIWTGIPIFILLYIALFSFDLLYKEDVIPDGKRLTYEGDGQTTAFVIENDFAKSRKVSRREHVDVYMVNAATGAKAKLAHGDDYSLDGLGDATVTVNLNQAPRPNEGVEIIAGRSRSGPGKYLGLFGEDRSSIVAAPGLTIKASGRQWGWDYSYPDYGDFEFSSNLAKKEDLADPSLYLLATDENIIVPEGETVRMIVTAVDVIHAWAMPSFAVKIDAVPGRLNETWFQAPAYTPGGSNTYYGQCSEICGIDHAYMPIAVEVVTREEFNAWVDEQRDLAGMEPMFDNQEVRFAENVAPATTAQQ